MAEIRGDILAALRTQEAALLAVLETVRQAIQTVLATRSPKKLMILKRKPPTRSAG